MRKLNKKGTLDLAIALITVGLITLGHLGMLGAPVDREALEAERAWYSALKP